MARRELFGGLGASLLLGCASAGPSPAPVVSAPVVSAPRPLGPDFVRGMNLAHLHQRGWGYGSERSRAQGRRLHALGVRDVALNPFAYTKSLSRPEVTYGGDRTMTDDDLRLEVRSLRELGMEVTMKPHLWAWSFIAGKGNGDLELDASGWRTWFERYTEFALHYARLAAETGCARYCAGLEYTSATRDNPGAWARLAGEIRKVFGGKLLYAANWYEEFEIFTDWHAYDLVGVNAYFPLHGNTVESLVASWSPHLDAIARAAGGRDVVFPECGYRAVALGTEKPWDPGSGPVDPAVQARGYEALYRACTGRPWFKGCWWWKWFTDLPGENDPYVPADLPAEHILKGWLTA